MKERMSYEELKQRLCDVSDYYDKCLFLLIYGTLAREGEIARRRNKTRQGLKKQDIEVFEDKIVVALMTEKTNIPRKVLISRELEPWLTEPVVSYISFLKLDDELFPFSTRWAEKKFLKYFPEFDGKVDMHTIHYLRAWRATHLMQGRVTGQPIPSEVVMRMGGWRKKRMLFQHYDHSITEDLSLIHI